MDVLGEGSSDSRKIIEKSEKARNEFFKKCGILIKSHAHSIQLMQDCADRAAQEYCKLFGRIGVNPLLHLKGGKKPPRYICERNEVWVLYKPPLWKQGGAEPMWKKSIQERMKTCKTIEQAHTAMVASDKTEVLQEWHGVSAGNLWLDQDKPPAGWGFIQRLDVETDGPVVIAKTWRSQKALQAQMKTHVFSKGYLCLVHGRVENKVQQIKCQFAEIGSDAQTQVMLKHDEENDPFYEWSASKKWINRSIRRAESFVKPIAYYVKPDDNTEYSLVYVNILSGITHQVRITMQSLGHPLVSDDRYLPKEQAMSDLKWCPRNFLVEVRSDWFDMCGPYKDEQRRRFTRMFIENPMPKLFQTILEAKLSLVEKIDSTADLYTGPQYWALGDEQLMAAFPKTKTYIRKVTRWGQRHGIHLDALNRLLLLSPDDIDEIIQGYAPPGDEADKSWVCPACMGYNTENSRRMFDKDYDPNACGERIEGGKPCPGKKVVDEKSNLPKGWMNYLADPTIHLLFTVNQKWLVARAKVLRNVRPEWEKPQIEPEGTECDRTILKALEPFLEVDARSGGHGVHEDDLKQIPGLEEIVLPLGQPPEDSKVQRVRLPGSGPGSAWIYTLKGKEKIKHSSDYNVKLKSLKGPPKVDKDKLPSHMIETQGDREKRAKQIERQKAKEEAAQKEDVRKKAEDERVEERAREKFEALKAKHGLENTQDDDGPNSKKRKTESVWKKRESKKCPGEFYYFNEKTGETKIDRPYDYKEAVVWKRIESNKHPGEFYYFNRETGQNRVDRPPGVEIENDKPEPKPKAEQKDAAPGVAWVRKESSGKPGLFYYFNPANGANEIHPPRVGPPWRLVESKTKKGQFYYSHDVTGQTTVHPPACARPSAKANSLTSIAAAAVAAHRPLATGGTATTGGLPPNWVRKESSSHQGKFYYENTKTGATSWTKPAEWERKESASKSGTFYYVNKDTGETSWAKPE